MISKVLNTHVRIWLNQPDKFAPLQSGGQSWLTQNSLSPSSAELLSGTMLAWLRFGQPAECCFFLKSNPSSLEMCIKPASESTKCCWSSQSPLLKHKSRKSLTKSVPKSEKKQSGLLSHNTWQTHLLLKSTRAPFPLRDVCLLTVPLTFFFLFFFLTLEPL